ncbi:MAG: UDP-N-acetylmuramoyl-tripeptide--D-alanyl-D-alanine ligase [Actinomycetota bacterium]|nr:UDP-N-acetylmuramoyl-tripeptide--D-alanyl-D-alanine ligase [Actinomycetota bacterium]
MGRADPFFGYSFLLRTIIFVLVPAFTAWQVIRFRRALHVFQLEGYKRGRFLEWCRSNRPKALFLSSQTHKKPLVMTGRAWRILVVAAVLNVMFILGLAAFAHLNLGGAPWDIVTWAIATIAAFFGAPLLLVLSDLLLVPVQAAINAYYRSKALARLRAVNPVVIGVTGSFGKTSTKVAIAGLLGGPDEAYATPGSYNTPMGVCRAINEGLEDKHRFFVVEMGAYKVGEIAELCRFVHPTIGVLTAIGPAHLERFGSMDAIKRGKYEIVESLPADGVAVMNVDDPEVRTLADSTESVAVVRYGTEVSGSPDITATILSVTGEGTSFTLVDNRSGASIAARTGLLGQHAMGHILAAVAVATSAGKSLEDVVPRIATLQPAEHRLQILKGTGGVTVIDDAFNSNPDGAAAALEVLAAMPGKRKVVVTPGIIELGPLQEEANENFGAGAARVADMLVVVARVNRDAIVAGAGRAGGKAEVIVVDSLDEATEKLSTFLTAGDVVLFENDLPDQYEN